MTGKTHLMAGVEASLIYLTAVAQRDFGAPELTVIQQVISVPLCLAGSLAPDIDLKTSTVGKETKVLSFLINSIFGHRTFSHSPLLLAMIYLLVNAHIPNFMWMAIPFIVGAASHLVLDMLNRSGIPLLWPIQTRFWALGIKTESAGERMFFIGLLCVTCITMVHFLTVIFKT